MLMTYYIIYGFNIDTFTLQAYRMIRCHDFIFTLSLMESVLDIVLVVWFYLMYVLIV